MNKRRRGYQDLRSKVFCLTVPKNFVGDPFSVSLVSGTKKVLIKRGGGVSKVSVESFLSQSVENFSRGNPLVFLIFGYRKRLDRRGEHQDYSSKTLSLTVPKNFVGETFGVSLISGTKKVSEQEAEGYQDFRSKVFRLTVPKSFVGEPFCVSLFLCIRRGYH